jgi:peptidoglycan/LPS O-acetylase OafA/YrhL
LLAYAFFMAAYALRDRRMPASLIWFGTISYSVYLFHPAVVSIMHDVLRNPWLALLTTVGLTLGLAHLSYTFVEAPAIRYGRTVNRRLDEPAAIALPRSGAVR